MYMFFLFLTLACYSADKSADAERYDPQTANPESQETDGSVWLADLQSNDITSSSRLDIRWNTIQNHNVALFQLEITEENTGSTEFLQLDSSQSQVTLDARKSDTTYSIHIEACIDEACSLRLAVQNNRLEVRTQPQRWVLQGTSLDTMSILSENVTLFSADSFNYQLNPEASHELWTYTDGEVQIYSQTESEYWDTLSSSCWDGSCFSDVQQLQLAPSALLVLDSDNRIYSQDPVDISSCSSECITTNLYSSEEDELRDFFYSAESEVLFWEGLSSCQEEAIFLAQANDDLLRTYRNAEGCPKPIVHLAESPRLLSSEGMNILYFQQQGALKLLYSKDDIRQWEDEDEARSLVLEWSDGTVVEEDSITIARLSFAAADLLYFSFRPAEETTEAYSLTAASLINP